MLRTLVIAVFLFQSLQMGWASAHAAAEAGHAVVHGHGPVAATVLEIATLCDDCHADGTLHACHDNHTHHTTVVGLGTDNPPVWPNTAVAGLAGPRAHEHLPSGAPARIERPKWATTTPVVVNL